MKASKYKEKLLLTRMSEAERQKLLTQAAFDVEVSPHEYVGLVFLPVPPKK